MSCCTSLVPFASHMHHPDFCLHFHTTSSLCAWLPLWQIYLFYRNTVIQGNMIQAVTVVTITIPNMCRWLWNQAVGSLQGFWKRYKFQPIFTPPRTPASHMAVLIEVPPPQLPKPLPVNTPGKAADYGSNTWVPDTHIGYVDGILSS